MLTVYTFVFTVVFQARWNIEAEHGRATFALVLFAGLTIHSLMAEVLGRSPGLMYEHGNYVKRVVFPLQVLPLVPCLSALFHFFISVIVLLMVMLLLGHPLHLTILWLPVVVAPLLPLLAGIGWLLSALGVYVRDISHVSGLLITVLLFVSPVFFPADALGDTFRQLMLANPLTIIIEQTRAVLLWGEPPSVLMLAGYSVVSCAVAWIGYAVFQRARGGFADVL
ncbi:ABC transporter permease [Halomonas cibimaris]|uniref:ABC transporter permease n=2 Tax=Halomonas cibimaris TaxID=657012 RepID=A0ABP7LCM4_9GAMM